MSEALAWLYTLKSCYKNQCYHLALCGGQLTNACVTSAMLPKVHLQTAPLTYAVSIHETWEFKDLEVTKSE